MPGLVRDRRRRNAGCACRPTATATCGPGGTSPGRQLATGVRRRPGSTGRAVVHRQPPGLGAGRRRVRRAARRGVRVRRHRPAARARASSPARPIAVAAFAEEEGGRFGVACLGSRLLTGAIDPDTARGAARRRRGHAWPRRCSAAGHDPARLGPDEDLLGRHRCIRRAAHRAGPGAGRPGRRGRPGRGHLAARPVAARLHRAGRPRGHRGAGRPGRPDAALRRTPCWPPGRPRPSSARWPRSARCGPSRARPTRSARRCTPGWMPGRPDQPAGRHG